MSDTTRHSPDDLGRSLRDALDFLVPNGPDHLPAVFALVPTPMLARMHPELVDPDDDSRLSLLAEEPLARHPGDDGGTDVVEPYAALEEFLATASWPEAVVGAAIVLEIVVLPPEAGLDLPEAVTGAAPDAPRLRSAARDHPDARAARLAVGALRDGARLALLELVPDDPDEARELRTHPDMAADLQQALATALDS
ncbi:PPA1309 family protein [Gordonia oryzae]|uniref:PPA1309 family protein n=1 Tax=Gordonia oryzae TaxID=2487349 RepID=UPI001FE3EA7E|nr:PPA1309 family protein [Gordonia oryzae]